jgi:hypothetical protein
VKRWEYDFEREQNAWKRDSAAAKARIQRNWEERHATTQAKIDADSKSARAWMRAEEAKRELTRRILAAEVAERQYGADTLPVLEAKQALGVARRELFDAQHDLARIRDRKDT